MIIDYRGYLTLWALAAVGYISLVPMIGRRAFGRYAFAYLAAVTALAFFNYVDWLWA